MHLFLLLQQQQQLLNVLLHDLLLFQNILSPSLLFLALSGMRPARPKPPLLVNHIE
jgi:hypothetical protein